MVSVPNSSQRVTKKMRIAIVLVTRWWRASIDLDGFAIALKNMGCELCLVCRGNDVGEAEFEVIEATEEQQSSPEFWRGQNLDVAIVFNWLLESSIVSALKEAQVYTICRSDSDGQFGIRVFPGPSFRKNVTATHWPDKLKQVLHLARRYVNNRAEDGIVLSSAGVVNAIVIETESAKQCLSRFFSYHNRSELSSKIWVIPHTVDDLFAAIEVSQPKSRTIFCGGRWGDAQKDAFTMARTIEEVINRDPTVEFRIAGSGASEYFKPLFAREPRVQVLGLIAKSELPDILLDCELILSSSRWETHPIGTLEALCCGCTVVGPPIPGFVDIIGDGQFGTLAKGHSAHALADAVIEELGNWNSGKRDAGQISTHWRSLVCNECVANTFLRHINDELNVQQISPSDRV